MPFRPSHRNSPHRAIDPVKPNSPTAIIALRPRRSERRAQRGAQTIHSTADQLKERLIHTSGTSSAVASDGMIETRALLPAADTMVTQNSSASRRGGRPGEGAAGLFSGDCCI